jgi:predicted nuclease of predicted toxin-antitoxin system
MRLKLDEHLGRTHAQLLSRAGHDVEGIRDEGLQGADDAEVWQSVRGERRFFITLDLGFADVRRYTPSPEGGILLLRPRNSGREAVLDILARVLREHSLEMLKGSLVVADASQTRIRSFHRRD